MAKVVDFSKAKVEMWTSGGGDSPFRTSNMNMGVNFYKQFPYKKDGKDISRTQAEVVNENGTFTQHLSDGLEVYMFSGNFKTSGTSFVIMANNGYQGWRVSNIKYDNNDTYVFAITVQVPNS